MAKAEKGFTLVELLMVIVIIGVLAALLLPALQAARAKARERRARVEAGQLEGALRSYFADNRGWLAVSGATASSKPIVDVLTGVGGLIPYMEFSTRNINPAGAFIDPWGSAYQIRLSGANNEVVARGVTLYRIAAVWSMGANGKTDTDGDDKDDDICSWK